MDSLNTELGLVYLGALGQHLEQTQRVFAT